MRFFEFLKKKLKHYGNDLGETNLLINIESRGNFTGDFFSKSPIDYYNAVKDKLSFEEKEKYYKIVKPPIRKIREESYKLAEVLAEEYLKEDK